MTKKEKEQYSKLKTILGYVDVWKTRVKILDIVKINGFHRLIIGTDYKNDNGEDRIYPRQALIKYNTRHKNGYFIFLDEIISLDNTKKPYNNYPIKWNVSWNFIKGLLDR